jgi:hypothetical protein
VEDGREAVHLPPEERLHRLRRDVARSEAGAAGGQDDVHIRVGDPGPDLGADGFDLVGDDRCRGERMARGGEPLGEQCSGRVGLLGARVGDGQHRDPQRMEGPAFVYSGHRSTPLSRAL